MKRCARTTCSERAEATLTYDNANQTAVVGPLGSSPTPPGHDLCRRHADSFTAPRGWEVIRLPESEPDPSAVEDDLLALANAIREVGLRHDDPPPSPHGPVTAEDLGDNVVVLAERGHLRMITDR